MILFLVLLVAAYVLVGVYAYENSWTHDMSLLGWHWSAVPGWWPVVAASVAIGVLFLVYMIYAGAVHGVRYGSVRRRLSTRESTISDLRTETTRLREENARLRGQLRGATAPASPPDEHVPTATAPTAESYRPQPSIGERMRSFFSGREPSGY